MNVVHEVRRRSRAIAAVSAVVAVAAAGVGVATVRAPQAVAAPCSDVDVVFARGTGEPAGFGIVGGPFTSAVTSALPGRTVSSYAVIYDPNVAQTGGAAGSTDLVNHLRSVAASCANTQFVLGGYSQGATVVDKALGIRTTTGGSGGTQIPSELSNRVAAIVVFGNPLGLQRQTIATASPTYGARSRDYCNSGDPVCGNGANIGAHLQYVSNGSAAAGATFAAGLVTSTAPPTTPPSTTPPTTTPPPTTTTPPTAGTCVTSSTRDHVAAGRATSLFGRAYAVGTRDSLGLESRFNFASLRQNDSTSWSQVARCQ